MIRKNKKVFILTRSFPPGGGSGIHRTVKFIKYITHYGWCSYVVVGLSTYTKWDLTMTNDIPKETKVFWKKGNIKYPSNYLKNRKKSFLEKVRNKLKYWLLLPDHFIISALLLLPLGKKVISKNNIKIIFASSPPQSILIGAAFLKMITGTKLVVDFRDPWTENPLIPWSQFKRLIQHKLERFVINTADVVVANTQELRALFKKKYPDKRIVIINNGYDPSDFEDQIEITNKKKALILVHTGVFYTEIRNPKTLLIAVGELYREGKIDASSLLIRFFGGGDLIEEDDFLSLMKRYELSEIVTTHKFIPHAEAIKEMIKADVLLLMQNNPKAYLQIPAKAFEYLYLRKPILSLSPGGATSNLIQETDSGIVVDPENIPLIKEKILELIRLKKEGQLQDIFSFRNITPYDRKFLALKLSDIFDSLL